MTRDGICSCLIAPGGRRPDVDQNGLKPRAELLPYGLDFLFRARDNSGFPLFFVLALGMPYSNHKVRSRGSLRSSYIKFQSLLDRHCFREWRNVA